MDLPAIRRALEPEIEALTGKGPGHALDALCQSLGMPIPPDLPSKRLRLKASLESAPDCSLPEIASRLLERCAPEMAVRMRLEDLLHPDGSVPAIPMRYRRELARGLDLEDLFLGATRFDGLLASLWDIDYDPAGG